MTQCLCNMWEFNECITLMSRLTYIQTVLYNIKDDMIVIKYYASTHPNWMRVGKFLENMSGDCNFTLQQRWYIADTLMPSLFLVLLHMCRETYHYSECERVWIAFGGQFEFDEMICRKKFIHLFYFYGLLFTINWIKSTMHKGHKTLFLGWGQEVMKCHQTNHRMRDLFKNGNKRGEKN